MSFTERDRIMLELVAESWGEFWTATWGELEGDQKTRVETLVGKLEYSVDCSRTDR